VWRAPGSHAACTERTHEGNLLQFTFYSWKQENMPRSLYMERRSRHRYALDWKVQYKLPQSSEVFPGILRDISSAGVCFVSGDVLPARTVVELSVNWPVLLQDVCPLKLVLKGRVVRSDQRGTALKVFGHEFRTRGSDGVSQRRVA
jgi:hypothetical protein